MMRRAHSPPEPTPGRDGDAPLEPPCSVIAPGLTASGRLESEGEVRIHGTLKGDICATRVVLCAGGSVEGNLIAREAVVGGRIEGRVFAFNVMVEGTAEVHGNVFHHELTVAAGAHLDGWTPWRPVNYFENLPKDLKGEIDEHVHAR